MEQGLLLDVDPNARHDEDFYRTPEWQTRALLRRLPSLRGLRVFEPCAGDGAIVGCFEPGTHVITNDIVQRGDFVPDFLLDATHQGHWEYFDRFDRGIDLVITNPPFDRMLWIVRYSVAGARRGVAMLARLSWLEPVIEKFSGEDRGAWMHVHPPHRLIVMPRHDYRGNGATDSVTSAWMIWNTDHQQPLVQPGIDVVTKKERDELIIIDSGLRMIEKR